MSPDGEIVRHSAATRILHWIVAASFLVTAFSAFIVYWPKVLGWAAPIFGGRKGAENLHPWFALVFTAAFAVQFAQWLSRMRWTPADTRFLRNIPKFGLKAPDPADPETGFFNGGQKAYFWAVAISAIIFLLTGLVWWYKLSFPHDVYMTCRFIHRTVGIVMLAALGVHASKATLGEPGTFMAMVSGRVTLDWVKRHRPGWNVEATASSLPLPAAPNGRHTRAGGA